MLKTYVAAIKKAYQALGAAQSELLLTIREARVILLIPLLDSVWLR